MKQKKTIIAVCAIALMAVIGAKATNGSEEVQLKANGKVCSYTVGCSCTGFQRGTGDQWEKEYCKKCHHHRKFHRS